MEPLLFLAHRLPYPPNKGDKVRSYHFLKHLARRYRVFLGTFVDDPADWQHVDVLRSLCADVHVEALVPWSKRALSATGFLSGEALSLPYFRSRDLRTWVENVARREGVKRAFAYSSPMAQYILDLPDVRCVVDFVDMDSAKWGEYAQRRSWPVSAVYEREALRLLAYEQAVATRAHASLFVTDEEAALFRAESPGCADHIHAVRNGVNSDYFAPSSGFASPFATDERPVVFTGAMDYWPNVDAVVWFAREVLPEIRKRDPAVRFYVVGMNPDAAVRALANDAAAIVTGRVDDVRPYLQHARVVVAPLRVARGIQNKVLEAMAMAKAGRRDSCRRRGAVGSVGQRARDRVGAAGIRGESARPPRPRPCRGDGRPRAIARAEGLRLGGEPEDARRSAGARQHRPVLAAVRSQERRALCRPRQVIRR